MTFRFLSFGGGIQTTALLLTEEKFDEVIFADTGAEKRQTYAYIEAIVKPFLAKQGTPFTVVRKMRDGKPETIVDYCMRIKNIPSIKWRWSTRDFKIRPMQKYMRASGRELPVRCAVGISTDEVERAQKRRDLREWNVEYPLLDLNMSRADCVKLITDAGWPLPSKSGCFICPYQPDGQWRDLMLLNPEEWEIAKKVEANARLRRPTISFNGGNETLDQMSKRFDGRLDIEAGKPCGQYGGFCLV